MDGSPNAEEGHGKKKMAPSHKDGGLLPPPPQIKGDPDISHTQAAISMWNSEASQLELRGGSQASLPSRAAYNPESASLLAPVPPQTANPDKTITTSLTTSDANVSALVIPCLRNLSRVVSADLTPFASEVAPPLWQDEMGRLRVWAANIGAHQRGQSSLDHRLRDSSHIKEQTIRVLGRLQRIIEDINDILNNSIDPEDDDFSDSSEFLSENGDCTEIQSIYQALRDTIDNLFQLSMIIRQPAQHDRLLGTKRSDACHYEHFDKQHVVGKYPEAREEVIDRLGLAISQRRAVLRYRERHRMKLGQGLNSAIEDEEDGKSAKLSDTVATTFVEASPMVKDEWESQTVASQTSYAPTMVSGTEGATLPSPPKDSEDGSPFECPYCFTIITIANRSAWARHVFNDLMPYLCIFPQCSTPHKLYESRREWFAHLKNQHSIQDAPEATLDCPLCLVSLPGGKQLERHVGRHLEELAIFALPRSGEDDEDPISSDENLVDPDDLSQDGLSDEASVNDPADTILDQQVKSDMQSSNEQSHDDLMTYLAQNLQSQGPFPLEWQANVPVKTRAMNVWSIATSLRLMEPKIDIQSAAQAALSFEHKSFINASGQSEYDLECTRRRNHIRETRIRQTEAAAPESQTAPEKIISQDNQSTTELNFDSLSMNKGVASDDEINEQPLQVLKSSDDASEEKGTDEGNLRPSDANTEPNVHAPDSQDSPDIINLRVSGTIHKLRFHKGVIHEDFLTIGMLRMAAAREVGVLDSGEIRLLLNESPLELDNVSCRAMGIKSHSEVQCVLSRRGLPNNPVITLWYCCACDFGPQNATLVDTCMNCHRRRCSSCPIEQIDRQHEQLDSKTNPHPSEPTVQDNPRKTRNNSPVHSPSPSTPSRNAAPPTRSTDPALDERNTKVPVASVPAISSDDDEEGEPRYCYCNEISSGQMIACDNDACLRQWFHLSCVGLAKPPGKDVKWYCNECKEDIPRGRKGRASSSHSFSRMVAPSDSNPTDQGSFSAIPPEGASQGSGRPDSAPSQEDPTPESKIHGILPEDQNSQPISPMGHEGQVPTSSIESPQQILDDPTDLRHRGNLPKHATDILRTWLHDNSYSPFPTDEEIEMLVTQTGLTRDQIGAWFGNLLGRQINMFYEQARKESEDQQSPKDDINEEPPNTAALSDRPSPDSGRRDSAPSQEDPTPGSKVHEVSPEDRNSQPISPMGHEEQVPTQTLEDPQQSPDEPTDLHRRGNLPKDVTDILRTWSQDHSYNPFPSGQEIQMLMTQTGLTEGQVLDWLENAWRRRSLSQFYRKLKTRKENDDRQSRAPNDDIDQEPPNTALPDRSSPDRGRRDLISSQENPVTKSETHDVSPEEPVSQPNSPMRQVEALKEEFNTQILPGCNKFLGTPPADENERKSERRRLTDLIMMRIVLAASGIKAEDPNVRTALLDVLQRARGVINNLDRVASSKLDDDQTSGFSSLSDRGKFEQRWT